MIGSREWMTLSNGKLSFKEKVQLIKQVLIPATLSYSKTFSKQPENTQQFELKNIHIPDTAIIKEAITELNNTKHQAIINHSWRSYIWGVAIAQSKDWQFDEESLLIASLMHDVGLADHQAQYSCQCFTLESALRSESLCAKHDFPQDKTDNISDAICLHMNGYLFENNQHLSKEVLLLQKATSCDVIGTDLALFSTPFKDEVLAQYPRHHFNTQFKRLLKTEVKRNPQSRTALMSKLGLPMMIQMNIFKE
ncbi:HD domain-containing protein [Acinetobacter wuhouensis]|uniref:HD domain-containing protein n=1 Tax=Acinetobacter wuhouensis TaxID=1879050 RepID=A0A4Q7AKK2_9GAMM|nr:HD domain-containing protein [Acinetobacter wuhouensis]RZG44154.1 HD domain-containing protein [Acinetobacter wuhouensis]RZG75591.1 HD domain-containing protein [Acinetobacter wuhouensis]